jgi:fructose-specific phosphotransferase system IIC component
VRTLWIRIGLAYLAAGFALVGFWAAFAPRSFYTDFPGAGRHWIAPDGPYNQHLIRDVGELNLAMLVVVVAAAITVSVPLVRAALLATLVNGALHVVYHIGHVDMFSSGDQVAIIGSLVLAPLVAIVLLATVRETPRRPVRDAVGAPAVGGSV